MAKAHLIAADGSTVNVEGTPKEIVELLKELKVRPTAAAGPSKSFGNDKENRKHRITVSGLFDELIGEQFFKKPKGMGEIQAQLANLGYHYPLTSLSGPLQSYVKRRKLRRFKQGSKYVYNQ